MYVGSDKCWSASMMATQWKDVEQSLKKSDEELKKITEQKKSDLELSLELIQNNENSESNQKLKLTNIDKEKLLDLMV